MKNTKLMSRFNCPIPLSTLASQLTCKNQILKFTEVLMENLILKSECKSMIIFLIYGKSFRFKL